MKRIIFYLVGLLMFTSCKHEYIDTEITTTTAEFPHATIQHTISFVAGEDYKIAVPFQVFGGEILSENKLNIAVKSTLPVGSYSVETTKNLTPNKYLDSVYVIINTAKIKNGENYIMELAMSSENIDVATNYSNCSLTIVQQAFMDFFSGEFECFESSTNTKYIVELAKIDDVTVKNLNFWDFPLSGQYVPFVFSQDDSHAVTIPENTEWIDKLGNKYEVSGNGTYELNGNFTISFVMKEFGSLEVYHSGTQKYTKK